MIKVIIFDLNGVLIVSEHLSRRFEREFGVPSDDFISALKDIIGKVRKPGALDAFELWEPYLEKWKVNLTEDQFLNFWFSGESVDTETLEYIKKLREQGKKVFIFSNNFKERTTYYRENFPEIFKNINGAYFSWETGYVKPSKESLSFVLKENNLEPRETVYFDDDQRNIDTAKELGVDGQLWTDLKTAKEYIEKIKI